MAGDRMRQARKGPSTAVATQASSPIDLGGDRYWLSPLDMRDVGRITEAIRAIVMARYRSMFGPELDEATIAAITKQAYQAADSIDLFNDPKTASKFFLHPEIITVMLWCSLRHEHPKLSIAAVGELLTVNDMPTIEGAIKDVFRLSGMSGDDDAGESPVAKGGEAEAGTFQPGDGVSDGAEGRASAE